MSTNTASKESDNTPSSDLPEGSVPAGFDMDIGRKQGDGWFIRSENAVLQGRLGGRFVTGKNTDGSEKAFYQITLQVPCRAIHGKGEDAKEITLGIGDLANVDDSAALKDLAPYAQGDGVYDVYVKFGAKMKLEGNLTYWPAIAGPALKCIKKPSKS